MSVASKAGKIVEGSFNAGGKLVKAVPSAAKKHPKSASALGGYAVGFHANSELQRRSARNTYMNQLMTSRTAPRAVDKHPYGGYYG